MPSVSMCLGTLRNATFQNGSLPEFSVASQSISQHVTFLVSLRTIVTRARRTRRRRAGTPRARGTRPAAAARARATPGTCGTRRAAPRTPRGPARRRPRPAAREKRDALTLVSGRCDRTATPSFCTPAASKQAKNRCEGFSQPLGARGKPSGSVSSASLLEAIKINRALVDGSNDDGCTTTPLAQ